MFFMVWTSQEKTMSLEKKPCHWEKNTVTGEKNHAKKPCQARPKTMLPCRAQPKTMSGPAQNHVSQGQGLGPGLQTPDFQTEAAFANLFVFFSKTCASIYLCIDLSIYLSIYLPTYLSLSLPLSLSLSLSLSESV